jgi:hypothetical protein
VGSVDGLFVETGFPDAKRDFSTLSKSVPERYMDVLWPSLGRVEKYERDAFISLTNNCACIIAYSQVAVFFGSDERDEKNRILNKKKNQYNSFEYTTRRLEPR